MNKNTKNKKNTCPKEEPKQISIKTKCIMDSVQLFVKVNEKFPSYTCVECDLSNICELCFESCHLKCNKGLEITKDETCFKQNFCLCSLNNHNIKEMNQNISISNEKSSYKKDKKCRFLELFLEFRPYKVYCEDGDPNKSVYCHFCFHNFPDIKAKCKEVLSNSVQDLFKKSCGNVVDDPAVFPNISIEDILVSNINNFLDNVNVVDFCIRYLGNLSLVPLDSNSPHKRFFSLMNIGLDKGNFSELFEADNGTQILNTLEFFRVMFKRIVNANYDFNFLPSKSVSSRVWISSAEAHKSSVVGIVKRSILNYVFDLRIINTFFARDLNINIKLTSIVLHILQSRIPSFFTLKNEVFELAPLLKIPVSNFESIVNMSLDEFLDEGFMTNFTNMVIRSFCLKTGYIAFNRDFLIRNFFKILLVILTIRHLSVVRLTRILELFESVFCKIKTYHMEIDIALVALSHLYLSFIQVKIFDIAMENESNPAFDFNNRYISNTSHISNIELQNRLRKKLTTSASLKAMTEEDLENKLTKLEDDAVINNNNNNNNPNQLEQLYESINNDEFCQKIAHILLKYNAELYFNKKRKALIQSSVKDIKDRDRSFYSHKGKDVTKSAIVILLPIFQNKKKGVILHHLEFFLRQELRNDIINYFNLFQSSTKPIKDTLWKGILEVKTKFYFNSESNSNICKSSVSNTDYFSNEENYLEDILRKTDTVKIFFENSEESYVYKFVELHLVECINLYEYICHYKGGERITRIKEKIIFSILNLFDFIAKTTTLFSKLFVEIKDFSVKLLFSSDLPEVMDKVFEIVISFFSFDTFKGDYERKLNIDLTQLFRFMNVRKESLFSKWTEKVVNLLRRIGMLFDKQAIMGYEDEVLEFVISKIPELSQKDIKSLENRNIHILKSYITLILYMSTKSFLKLKNYITPVNGKFNLVDWLLKVGHHFGKPLHDFRMKILNLFTYTYLTFPFYLNMETIVDTTTKKGRQRAFTNLSNTTDKMKQIQYKESLARKTIEMQQHHLRGSTLRFILNTDRIKKNSMVKECDEQPRGSEIVIVGGEEKQANMMNVLKDSIVKNKECLEQAEIEELERDRCPETTSYTLDMNFNCELIDNIKQDLIIKTILEFKDRLKHLNFHECLEEYKEFVLKSVFSLLHFFLYQLSSSNLGDDKLYIITKLTLIIVVYLRDILRKIDLSNQEDLDTFKLFACRKFATVKSTKNQENCQVNQANKSDKEGKKSFATKIHKTNKKPYNTVQVQDNFEREYSEVKDYIKEINEKIKTHLVELTKANIMNSNFKLVFEVLNYYLGIFLDFESSRKVSRKRFFLASSTQTLSVNVNINNESNRIESNKQQCRLSKIENQEQSSNKNPYYYQQQQNQGVEGALEKLGPEDDAVKKRKERMIKNLENFYNAENEARKQSSSKFLSESNKNSKLYYSNIFYILLELSIHVESIIDPKKAKRGGKAVRATREDSDDSLSMEEEEEENYDDYGDYEEQVSEKSRKKEDYSHLDVKSIKSFDEKKSNNKKRSRPQSREPSELGKDQQREVKVSSSKELKRIKQAETINNLGTTAYAKTKTALPLSKKGEEALEEKKDPGSISFASLESLLSLAQTETYYQFLQSKMLSNSVRFAPKLFYLIEHEIPNLMQMFIIGFKSSKYDYDVLPLLANSIEFVRLHCEGYSKYFQTFFTYYLIRLPNKEEITFVGLIMKFYLQILQIAKQYALKVKAFKIDKIFYKDLNTLVECSNSLINLLVEITQGNFDINFVEIYCKEKFLPISLEICCLIGIALAEYKDQQADPILRFIEGYLKLLVVLMEEYQSLQYASPLLDLINFKEICNINYLAYLILIKEMGFLKQREEYFDKQTPLGKRKFLNGLNIMLLDEDNRKITYKTLGFELGCLSHQVIQCYCYLNKDENSYKSYIDIPSEQGVFDAKDIDFLKLAPQFFSTVVKGVEISIVKQTFYNNQEFSEFSDYFQKEKFHKDYEKIFNEIKKPGESYKYLIKIYYVMSSDGFYYDEMKSINWLISNIGEDYTENLKQLFDYCKTDFLKDLTTKKALYQNKQEEHFERYDNFNENEKVSLYFSILSNLILIYSMKLDPASNNIQPAFIAYVLLFFVNLLHITWNSHCIYIYYKVKTICALNKEDYSSLWYSVKKILSSNRTHLLCYNITISFLAILNMQYLLPFQLFITYRFSNTLKILIFSIKIKFWDFISALILISFIVLFYSSVSVYYFSKEIVSDYGEKVCQNFFECFFYLFSNGFRTGLGFNFPVKGSRDEGYWMDFAADWSFYFLLILIMANIINAIIVDLFQKISDQETNRMEFLTCTCMICGINEEDFKMLKIKYLDHITQVHHVYFYIQYFYYLRNVQDIDLSRSNSLVKKMIECDNITFLPTGQTSGLTKE